VESSEIHQPNFHGLGAQPRRRTHSDQAGRAMQNGYIETFNGECQGEHLSQQCSESKLAIDEIQSCELECGAAEHKTPFLKR
jgi:hypothetical protein